MRQTREVIVFTARLHFRKSRHSAWRAEGEPESEAAGSTRNITLLKLETVALRARLWIEKSREKVSFQCLCRKKKFKRLCNCMRSLYTEMLTRECT